MKLVWLDLNSSYAHASLALPAIHAQTGSDEAGAEWHKVQATVNERVEAVVNQVVSIGPDVVAATCWLFTCEALMHVLARVKTLLPHCRIILGGPEFLGHNEAFLRHWTFVDVVLRGEGESVFPQWLRRCGCTSQEWKDLPGLCYLNEVGEYCDNGMAHADFVSLLPPEQSRFFSWNKPFVQLETTRGCFNTCAFCVSAAEKPVRTLPVDVVARRLEIIHDKGIRDVRMLDRTFNYNSRHAHELLDLFCRYPDMHFHLEVHPGILSADLMNCLAAMPDGMLHLEAGIQSLRADVLQQSRRAGEITRSLEGLRYLCSLKNLVVHADLIAGLPRYGFNDLLEDVHTLASYCAGEIQLELLKLLPGTEMRKRAKEWGICYSPLPPYEVLQTDSITSIELQTAHQLSRLLDGFYNTMAWQSVVRALMLEHRDFLSRFLVHLIDMAVIDVPLSLERRGLILYDFCKQYYPAYCIRVSLAWIEAGFSLKKTPAEHVQTRHVSPPSEWDVLQGVYNERLRLCFLPSAEEGCVYWYGYEREQQQARPVFKAISR